MDVQLVMPDRLAAKHPASAVGAMLIMAGLVFFPAFHTMQSTAQLLSCSWQPPQLPATDF